MSVIAQSEPVRGARNIITRFTLRRTVLGAILFGLFAAAESVAQGLGIIAAYPNAAQRAKVVYGLASNAALGLFYGDRHANIISPSGYMVYRILPILTLVGSIWSLLFITKMLRGQEESGRWELLLTGQTSAEKATAKTIMGTSGGLAIAYVLMTVILLLTGQDNKFKLSLSGCLFYSLAVIAGAAVAVGIGALTSQLAATRRKAVVYGLGLIIVLFGLRSTGNIVDSLAWIKNLTPFGWIDKLHPFYHPQPIWLVPLALCALVCCGLAVWLAGDRDMAESLIADSATAKPRFRLLNSQFGFTFRLTRAVMAGWLLASVAIAALIAGIDKTVIKSLSGTNTLTKVFSKLSGNPYAHLELAYLGAAGYLTVTILMIMVTSGLGSVREEEASSRLDNLVSGMVARTYWLAVRLLVLVCGAITITLITNLVIWLVADLQGIHVSIATLLFGGLNILGPVMLLLGIGVFFYGIMPRAATIVMYALVAWSFTIDIIASALKTSKFLADTSLLHYISLVPAANPNWKTFTILVALGLVLIGIGTVAFQKRDLEAE